MLDMILGLAFLLVPFATGFLWLLINVADDPGYDADPQLLTAIGFFWPVTLPFLFFVAVPVVVWQVQTRHGESLKAKVASEV